MSKIALATCAPFPAGDADDAQLPRALGDATWAVWDDPSVDWGAFALVVVRSTWDYQERRDEFLAWCESIGDRLRNPVEVVRWNTDKRYLVELADAGLPVVPTRLDPDGLPDGEYVIKPTVSAGSRDTARFTGDDPRARALLDRIRASGRTAMLQPYVPSVDERGETALLHFGGELSHAIRKGPILERGADPTHEVFAAEDISPREPTRAERDVAARVLSWVQDRFGTLPYARVDLVEGPGGEPQLLELELTEPSLFLAHSPGAVDRFAAALLAST